MSSTKPPYLEDYDEELRPAVHASWNRLAESETKFGPIFTVEHQRKKREGGAKAARAEVEAFNNIKDGIVVYEQHVIGRSEHSGDNVDLAIVRPSPNLPTSCILFIHGGARIASDRFVGLAANGLLWAKQLNAVTVSVEYRLGPDYLRRGSNGQEPLDDCYAALEWVFAQIDAKKRDSPFRNVSKDKVLIYGASAGAGLGTSLALKWKEQAKHEAAVCGLFVEAGMLDDRNTGPSCKKFIEPPMFNSKEKELGWRLCLGDRMRTPNVTMYEAPARATVEALKGLPPTYIFVGSADPLYSENEELANRLAAAGVEVECRVWKGGFHGFFVGVPEASISKMAVSDGLAWMEQILHCPETHAFGEAQMRDKLLKSLKDGKWRA